MGIEKGEKCQQMLLFRDENQQKKVRAAVKEAVATLPMLPKNPQQPFSGRNWDGHGKWGRGKDAAAQND